MIDIAFDVNLMRYIDSQHFGKRPHIRGRRLPVAIIAYTLRDNAHYGIPELMYAFDLTEAQVLAALLYYHLHREEIDAQEQAEFDAYEHLYDA